MLKFKFLVTFAALMLLITGVSTVTAQTDALSMGPNTRPFDSGEGETFDSDLYEYDAQLWAPYDVTEMSRDVLPSSGYYAQLGFSYLNISGGGEVDGADPRNFESPSSWNWGRDFEVGYMTSKESGWSLNWLDLQGNNYLYDSAGNFGNSTGFGQSGLLKTQFDSVSLNKQFRQSLSTGGYIEPFIGMRYMSLIDNTVHDRPLLTRRFAQNVNNSMIGAHVGSKYFRNYGRVKLGASFGMGALYNDQNYEASTGIALGPQASLNNNENDFVPVADFGLTANYNLTRDISFRVGAKLHYLWEGVARADTRQDVLNPNSGLTGLPLPSSIESGDLVVGGFSFGIDWRR